jgi:hypothetical protein
VSPDEKRQQRSTPDLIVIMFAVIIAFVVLVAVIGGIILRITSPNADIDNLIGWAGDLTNTLIGAVVGYIAGKGAVAVNGSKRPSEPND